MSPKSSNFAGEMKITTFPGHGQIIHLNFFFFFAYIKKMLYFCGVKRKLAPNADT